MGILNSYTPVLSVAQGPVPCGMQEWFPEEETPAGALRLLTVVPTATFETTTLTTWEISTVHETPFTLLDGEELLIMGCFDHGPHSGQNLVDEARCLGDYVFDGTRYQQVAALFSWLFVSTMYQQQTSHETAQHFPSIAPGSHTFNLAGYISARTGATAGYAYHTARYGDAGTIQLYGWRRP